MYIKKTSFSNRVSDLVNISAPISIQAAATADQSDNDGGADFYENKTNVQESGFFDSHVPCLVNHPQIEPLGTTAGGNQIPATSGTKNRTGPTGYTEAAGGETTLMYGCKYRAENTFSVDMDDIDLCDVFLESRLNYLVAQLSDPPKLSREMEFLLIQVSLGPTKLQQITQCSSRNGACDPGDILHIKRARQQDTAVGADGEVLLPVQDRLLRGSGHV
ncbi:hypothetical protein AYI68_g6925 [Smittium mucronatum]|uniref:Uncharacterized protein n=1 Tax=Smittium mucronatum TaxID=133383 RepID=A0A1R0GQ44_9FUNG|nr:hypothetical protein AYI68_g6925 [Smittium mucronatum]